MFFLFSFQLNSFSEQDKSFPNLETLNLSSCNELVDEGLEEILIGLEEGLKSPLRAPCQL